MRLLLVPVELELPMFLLKAVLAAHHLLAIPLRLF
jgi:hypothetical protein